jgi:osmotically inducible protein OsmC
MTRNSTAVWKGGLKDGRGVVSTESGVLNQQAYTFKGRFEDSSTTNPEELLAAAHAACFAMALSGQLAEQGMVADSLEVTSSVTIQNLSIDKVHLNLLATIPNADAEKFKVAADNAKAGCPVSKLFRAEITMNAELKG